MAVAVVCPGQFKCNFGQKLRTLSGQHNKVDSKVTWANKG